MWVAGVTCGRLRVLEHAHITSHSGSRGVDSYVIQKGEYKYLHLKIRSSANYRIEPVKTMDPFV